jgi:hypothetical protein
VYPHRAGLQNIPGHGGIYFSSLPGVDGYTLRVTSQASIYKLISAFADFTKWKYYQMHGPSSFEYLPLKKHSGVLMYGSPFGIKGE